MVGGQELALEVVEAGRGHLARPQGIDQRVGVVERGPAELRKTTRARIAANWSAPIIPVVSGVTGAWSETTSAARAARRGRPWLVGVRVVGDDLHAEPPEPPPQRPGHGAEPDQTDRAAGQLQARNRW